MTKDGNINWLEVGANTAIGYVSPGYGWKGNVLLNSGGAIAVGATNNYLDGKSYGLRDFGIDATSGAVGGWLGWKGGSYVTSYVDRTLITSTSARWVVSSASLNQSAVLNTTLGLNLGYGAGAGLQAFVNYGTDRFKTSVSSTGQ